MPRKSTRKVYKRSRKRPRRKSAYLSMSNPWLVPYAPRTNQTLTLLRPVVNNKELLYSPGLDTFLAITHTLDDIENVGAFQEMFDQYRIDCVYLDFTPRTTNNPQSQSNRIPNYTVAVDRDDDNILPAQTFNSIKARKGSKTQNCVQRRTFKYIPSRLTGAINTQPVATLEGAIIDKNVNEFINTRNGKIKHFGLKCSIDGQQGGPNDNSYTMDIRLTYKITFKNLQF